MDNKFGKISRISACAALKDGRTILEDLSFTAPYKIMMPFEKENGGIQIMPLCAMGVTACFATHMALLSHLDQLGTGVNIFPRLEGNGPMTQSLSLLRHRQRYLTHFSKYFMELLFETTARMEQVQIAHIV